MDTLERYSKSSVIPPDELLQLDPNISVLIIKLLWLTMKSSAYSIGISIVPTIDTIRCRSIKFGRKRCKKKRNQHLFTVGSVEVRLYAGIPLVGNIQTFKIKTHTNWSKYSSEFSSQMSATTKIKRKTKTRHLASTILIYDSTIIIHNRNC